MVYLQSLASVQNEIRVFHIATHSLNLRYFSLKLLVLAFCLLIFFMGRRKFVVQVDLNLIFFILESCQRKLKEEIQYSLTFSRMRRSASSTASCN
jgi:hypothetical protein